MPIRLLPDPAASIEAIENSLPDDDDAIVNGGGQEISGGISGRRDSIGELGPDRVDHSWTGVEAGELYTRARARGWLKGLEIGVPRRCSSS
jgi:hypothetical protein